MALARIWMGGILAVWAAVFFTMALYFDKPLNPFDSGAAAFPMLISASLFITSVWMMIQEFRRLPTSEPVRAKRFGANLFSAVLIILYAFSMPYAGYYLSTLAFIPAFLLASNERRWKLIIAVTAILLAFTYLSFDRLLGVSLPRFGAAFVE
ncbi:MAG: tripartite tricarboxylate transporter TctB family protein [Hyphomicrobiales bacterium]